MEWQKYFEHFGNKQWTEENWGWEPLTPEVLYQMFKARYDAEQNPPKSEAFTKQGEPNNHPAR